MDFDEYRKRGKEMVDYIADYLENIRDRPVFPNVKPGYMRTMLPDHAPLEGEEWDKIFGDVEKVIMPGVTHWQSPHMHAYFPALNSFPSLLGDMLADAINCLGFTWASSPACTELETIVMNWLGKMIGLPDDFLHTTSSSKGGGVIQTTASEATLVCLLAGRTQAIKAFHEKTPGYQDSEINARLVAYCSEQAHSSVEKAALIGLVRMRYIESDDNLSLRGDLLREAISDDIQQGLIPFWVCATLGTTGACAFDNLEEVGQVCRDYNLWLHVDAAYAGSAFICPEYRIWLKGIEKADSIAFNPSKWLMVHFDCTAMWVKDSNAVHRTFNVEPLYLQHENSGLAIDYMHWQIPLSKRFRALKLWFVLRSFGIKGLQKHIREGVRLAQKFEALILADYRFEIPALRHLGMVVFRIKGENNLTERLLKRLNHRGNLHCVPASLKGKYVIRFTVTSTRTTTDDILSDWSEIRQVTTELLEELNVKICDRVKVPLKETRQKNEAFGSSLLLANSPMSPKVVNGSFAAIFDADEFLAKAYAGIRITNQDSPSMRRRVRGILMSGKQFSLDSRMDLVAHSCIDSSAKRNQDDSNTTNAIREDNEDVWEVCEDPGTPPGTPPPIISPCVQSPSDVEVRRIGSPTPPPNLRTTSHLLSPIVARQFPNQFNSNTDDSVRVPNNLRNTISNTQTNHKRIHPVDTTVFIHKSEPLLSTNTNEHNCCVSSMCLSSAATDRGHSLNLARNETELCNGYESSCSGDSTDCSESSDLRKVYHGKRYLDPIQPEVFYRWLNAAKTLRISSDSRANFFSIIEESPTEEFPSEMKAVNSNREDPQKRLQIPKFHFRVHDESGKRIRTSFDCSDHEISSPENSSAAVSPNDSSTLSSRSFSWSSLDIELDEDVNIDDDAWTIVPAKRANCCQKCGHSILADIF